MDIDVGAVLDATTSSGTTVRLRAISKPMKGSDFPVVWLCTEEEFERSRAAGDEADGLPWPLDAVRLAAGCVGAGPIELKS